MTAHAYSVEISRTSKAVISLSEAEYQQLVTNDEDGFHPGFQSAMDLDDVVEYARLTDGRTIYRTTYSVAAEA